MRCGVSELELWQGGRHRSGQDAGTVHHGGGEDPGPAGGGRQLRADGGRHRGWSDRRGGADRRGDGGQGRRLLCHRPAQPAAGQGQRPFSFAGRRRPGGRRRDGEESAQRQYPDHGQLHRYRGTDRESGGGQGLHRLRGLHRGGYPLPGRVRPGGGAD